MNLAATIELHAGGPGSGCNPAAGHCGRPGLSEDQNKKFPNLGGKIPDAGHIPDEGQFAAVRTTDGQIFADPNWQGNTHVLFINQKGIPPDKVESGGWLKDGVYEETSQSDAARYGERARALLSTLKNRKK